VTNQDRAIALVGKAQAQHQPPPTKGCYHSCVLYQLLQPAMLEQPVQGVLFNFSPPIIEGAST
jgi:hypothetical protein